MLKPLLALFLSFVSLYADKSCEEVFTTIYKNGDWGRNPSGIGVSGPGSTFNATIPYWLYLQTFLKEKGITSVVDLGCGDWEFSQKLDWSGIHYIGVDVVQNIIERNKKLFSTSLIEFVKLDATEQALPAGELLICKDVLQHLSDTDIQKVIPQFSKFKYCLITNDCPPKKKKNKPYVVRGGYRVLDLTKPPFNLVGKAVLEYKCENVTKRVLLITNQEKSLNINNIERLTIARSR